MRKRMLYSKIHQIERQNDFWSKNANNRGFHQKSKKLGQIWAEEPGQQVPVIKEKKNTLEIFLTLKGKAMLENSLPDSRREQNRLF